jgi:signal transduction histidine kinase
LNADKFETAQAGVQSLASRHRDIADLFHAIPRVYNVDISTVGLIPTLRRLVENDFARDFDEVSWDIDKDADEIVRSLPTFAAEVLHFAAREAIRNAAHHARGTSENHRLNLIVRIRCNENFQIMIEDNRPQTRG